MSCVVNTVHDSIVIDIHPNEVDDVITVINDVNDNMTELVNKKFNINLNVPLLLEAKLGDNWLDMKEVV
jgi:DNA polymerase I-like protein with 3'-5' exonuclease and polymerase domains